LAKLLPHLEVPADGWEIETDGKGKMAWFKREAVNGLKCPHFFVLLADWPVKHLSLSYRIRCAGWCPGTSRRKLEVSAAECDW